MPKNKVRFGIENLHVAFKAASGWDTPVHIPGVVGFTANPDGAESTFYADNIKYYVVSNNNGYTGDLETALFPDEILNEMLGWYFDANGVQIEDAEGIPKEFALLGQYQGDKLNRRFVYYNTLAARPGQTHATKGETVTPQTETVSVTILPIENATKKIVRSVVENSEATKTIYDNWFNAVYLPDADAVLPSKTTLDVTIAFADSLTAADYTNGAAMTTALTAAKAVAADTEATQPEIDEANETLGDAILALVPVA